MFCKNCGNELNINEKYCSKCGCEIDNIAEKTTAVTIADISDTKVIDSNINSCVKNQQRNKIIGIVAVLLIISIIGIIFGMHFNSDSYKISKATDYLLNGKTSNALNKISDIYTSQADVMRGYAAITDAENNFKSYCDSKTAFGVSADENDYSAVENFIDSLGMFYENYENQMYLLPNELQEQAEYYRAVCMNLTHLSSAEDTFSNLLKVYDNGFIKNNILHITYIRNDDFKYYFTLNGLKENIDTTNTAYEDWCENSLKVDDANNGGYIDFSKEIFSDFMANCNSLAESCKHEADAEQEFINSESNERDVSELICMKEIDENYTVSIIQELPNATGDNIKEFSSYFTYSLQLNLLRYYLFYNE